MTWDDWKILVELQIVVVFLIDLSGAVDSFKDALGRWLKVKVGRLKPIDCSLCMYHWTALGVMYWTGRLTLESYTAVCLLAFTTTITRDALICVLRAFIWVISKLTI